MKKDVAKRQNILNQLEHHPELDAEIIEACEGRKLQEDELKRLGYPVFKNKYGDFGTLPAFGCSVSHLSVYDKIIENGDDVALVLEDDVILSSELTKELSPIYEFMRQTNQPMVILLTPDFIYNIKEQSKHISEKFRIVNLVAGYMATGYLLNGEGARLLSEKLRPIRHVADDWKSFKSYGLNVFGVTPHLVSYSGELGEIGQSQRPKDEPILLRLRHLLGRTKAHCFEILRHLKGYRRSKRIW